VIVTEIDSVNSLPSFSSGVSGEGKEAKWPSLALKFYLFKVAHLFKTCIITGIGITISSNAADILPAIPRKPYIAENM